MDNREVIGSWLSGPRAAAEDMGIADVGYRGKRLGLPEEGPGSLASPGRRLGALFIDWAYSSVIAFGLLSGRELHTTSNWALVVFLVVSLLTVGTVGSTPGKRLLGLRVVSLNNLGRLPLWRVLVRTVLLGLAVPALIWDRDNRGLHDQLSGAVQVRV
ncbi:RDD family protein [Streptomyces iconiensis]|uniref:RDD family protein n=1 Tax=Streptomyces iconiensis TaxID=1384038 RepID=A0ABT7A6T2_9ACTN|nr:RDD family protein [Streptomyces iconiensis]MDJ1137026.1 RDD family protein [Streptomyces iconiensis]